MSTVLVIAEHLGGKLNPSTAKCVTCAATISGAAIDVVVFAADGTAVAQEAARQSARVLPADDQCRRGEFKSRRSPTVSSAHKDNYMRQQVAGRISHSLRERIPQCGPRRPERREPSCIGLHPVSCN